MKRHRSILFFILITFLLQQLKGQVILAADLVDSVLTHFISKYQIEDSIIYVETHIRWRMTPDAEVFDFEREGRPSEILGKRIIYSDLRYGNKPNYVVDKNRVPQIEFKGSFRRISADSLIVPLIFYYCTVQESGKIRECGKSIDDPYALSVFILNRKTKEYEYKTLIKSRHP